MSTYFHHPGKKTVIVVKIFELALTSVKILKFYTKTVIWCTYMFYSLEFAFWKRKKEILIRAAAPTFPH